MNFTTYDSTTGKILLNVTCIDESTMDINFPGINYILGNYSGNDYYIDITSKNPISKPINPSGNFLSYDWDPTNKIWTLNLSDSETNIRRERNSLLGHIDKVNSVWYASLTADQQTELSAYRTALLNVPQQSGFPMTIEWPTKPTWL